MEEQDELGIAQLELQAAEAKLLRRYREGKLRLRSGVAHRRGGGCPIRRYLGCNDAVYFVINKLGHCTEVLLLR